MPNIKGRKKLLKARTRISQGLKMKQVQIIRNASIIIFLLGAIFFLTNFLNSKKAVAIKEKAKNELVSPPTKNQLITNGTRFENETHSTKGGGQNSSYRIGYVNLTNKGILYISSGTTLASEGSFFTASSGNTENNGNLYLKGDWNNDGTYTKDNGKVIFWDVDDQYIDGLGNLDFYNMEINKSPGTVSMNSDMTVSNNLNLLNGKIDLNLHSLTISNSATSGITYTNGFLLSENVENSSKVKWNIGTTTGSHVIPFGTGSDVVIPLTLNLTSGNIGTVTASTYATLANNTPYPISPDSVLHLRDNNFNDNSANLVDRFWQIDKTGPSGTLTVTFTYAPGEEPANGETSLVGQLYYVANKGWLAPFSSQTSNAAANTVTTPGISNFGPFAISKSSSPLPVELLDFSIKMNDKNEVDLIWSTTVEINNDYFTIQRSTDLVHIEEIKQVPGGGNSTKLINYRAEDNPPYTGDIYYRIKQTDFDGTTKNSDWRHVYVKDKTSPEEFSIHKVYPNPFSDGFKVEYFMDKEADVTMQLFNELGQVLFSEIVHAGEGLNSYSYSDKGSINLGVYYFQISCEGKSKSIKLVKKN